MTRLTGLWGKCRRIFGRNRLSQRDAAQLVDTLYRKLLLRAPDPSGLETYTALLREGGATVADVLDALMTSPEFFANRAELAQHYYPHQRDGFFADISQFGEVSTLLRAMIDMSCTNKILVDVGVMGRSGSNSYDLLRWFGWQGLLVEANSGLIDSIKAQFGPLNYRIVNSAVSDHAGTATLHIGSSDGVSSLNEGHSRMFGATRGSITVQLETLPAILEREQIPLHFDLLSIDIEGEDMKVLNHLIASSPYRPNWIIVEAGDVGDYRAGSLPLLAAFDEDYEAAGQTQANLIFRRRGLAAALPDAAPA